jgi:hypothetical protein
MCKKYSTLYLPPKKDKKKSCLEMLRAAIQRREEKYKKFAKNRQTSNLNKHKAISKELHSFELVNRSCKSKILSRNLVRVGENHEPDKRIQSQTLIQTFYVSEQLLNEHRKREKEKKFFGRSTFSKRTTLSVDCGLSRSQITFARCRV